MAHNFLHGLKILVTIMSTSTKIFVDGVNCTDNSKFIDYPQVKLRSYESGKFTSIKKITIYLFTFSVMSAIAAFFLIAG